MRNNNNNTNERENMITTTTDFGTKLTTIERTHRTTKGFPRTESFVIKVNGKHVGSMSVDSAGTVRIAGEDIEIENAAF